MTVIYLFPWKTNVTKGTYSSSCFAEFACFGANSFYPWIVLALKRKQFAVVMAILTRCKTQEEQDKLRQLCDDEKELSAMHG